MQPLRPLVALALLAAPAPAQTFTVVGLPDTQRYSESFPAIFAQQAQWIVDQADALDVRYVAHYGDVVQHGDDLVEWQNADAAMAALDALGLPYGVTPGNHDVLASGSSGEPYIPRLFLAYFGAERFVGKTWYRGTSPDGMSNFQVFTAGGLQFVGLHLECDAPLDELVWARGVVDAHRDKPVLLTTHRYLQDAEDYTGGVPVVPSGRYPEVWYSFEGLYTPGGVRSEDLWDWFVRRSPNVFLVQCGHFHEEYRQSSVNAAGRAVHEVLADYQDDPNGGDGWLRLMEFDVAAGRIDVESYSPFLDAYRTADESRFTLWLDFADYRETRPTVVLQQGIAGYAGTRDTWIDEANPNAAYGDDSVRESDDDVENSLFTDDQGQALVRFQELFQGDGAGRVPPGATIASAHLTLQVSDDVDTPLFDPDFFVHRVLVPWEEDSTWNTLGGGLSGGELSGVVAVLAGDNSPDGDGHRRLDVTSAVQAWADGAPNHGFAILPEVISGNDDGITILTSESPNPLLRPMLEVVWEAPDCGFATYGAGATPAHVLELTGGGRTQVGGTAEFLTGEVTGGVTITAVATAPADVPFRGGRVLVDLGAFAGLETFPAPGGLATWIVPLPNDATLAGQSFFAQSVGFDPGLPEGLAFSNGVELAICP